jgi:hypothetical protein
MRGNTRLKLEAECVSVVLSPYGRDGVMVGFGVMMVNGWSPWIWIAAWNVIWVGSYLEPVGPLPETVRKTSY